MFRYSKAVLKMKEIIKEHGPPKAFNARYNCAYSTISKDMWWDLNSSGIFAVTTNFANAITLKGGPIIEQATHFCDLARFLMSDDVDLSTLKAISIKQTDSAGFFFCFLQ